jgi:hypothetical protein
VRTYRKQAIISRAGFASGSVREMASKNQAQKEDNVITVIAFNNHYNNLDGHALLDN